MKGTSTMGRGQGAAYRPAQSAETVRKARRTATFQYVMWVLIFACLGIRLSGVTGVLAGWIASGIMPWRAWLTWELWLCRRATLRNERVQMARTLQLLGMME